MDIQEQYTRALKRAHDEGITVCGDSISPTGRRAWSVVNPAHGDSGWYTVRLEPGANTMTCSCRATVLCKHIAAVVEVERMPPPGPCRTVGQMHDARLGQGSLWS